LAPLFASVTAGSRAVENHLECRAPVQTSFFGEAVPRCVAAETSLSNRPAFDRPGLLRASVRGKEGALPDRLCNRRSLFGLERNCKTPELWLIGPMGE